MKRPPDAEEILTFWFSDAVTDPDKAKERHSFWFVLNRSTDEEYRGAFRMPPGGRAPESWHRGRKILARLWR